MPGSIFDDSFQTAIPQLDTKAIWTANLLRDKARSLDGVLTSLDKIGKVFTDAEDSLKKANTASLGNYLKSMPWDQRIALEQAEFNPAVLLAQSGVPVDISNAELNKASQDSYAAARKDKTANWVTTMLPRISQRDWVDYMMGKRPNLFRDYGMDATMDFANNEDLRQDVQAARKAAANLFVKSFDADHKINPIDAVKRGMTIDEWRWSVASPEERSVLAQADKDYSDKPQEIATAVADALLKEQLAAATPEDRANMKATDLPPNATPITLQDKEPWIKKILGKAAVDYINNMLNPNYNNFGYDVVPFYEYASEHYDLDNPELTSEVRALLDKYGRTFDLTPYWGRSPSAALPGLDPNSNVTEEDLNKYYKRLEALNPKEYKKRHAQYVTNNAEMLKKYITKEDMQQLTTPGVNTAVVDGIKKKYTEPYKRKYTKEYYDRNIEPTWNRVFEDIQREAADNERRRAAMYKETNTTATQNLNNNRLVKLIAGDTGAPSVDAKATLINKDTSLHLKDVKAVLEEVMPEDVQKVYSGLDDEGKAMLLTLTLAWLGNGDYRVFARYSEKDRQQEIRKLKGRKNEDLDLPYKEAVKQIQAMQPYKDKHKPADTADELRKRQQGGQ